MKGLLKAAGAALKRLGAAAVDLYRRYPARGNSYILAALAAVAAALGVVVDQQSAGKVIELVLPILLGGEATHHLVSPVR
jgi:hypothetical protein